MDPSKPNKPKPYKRIVDEPFEITISCPGQLSGGQLMPPMSSWVMVGGCALNGWLVRHTARVYNLNCQSAKNSWHCRLFICPRFRCNRLPLPRVQFLSDPYPPQKPNLADESFTWRSNGQKTKQICSWVVPTKIGVNISTGLSTRYANNTRSSHKTMIRVLMAYHCLHRPGIRSPAMAPVVQVSELS